jgi:hypothetical protein
LYNDILKTINWIVFWLTRNGRSSNSNNNNNRINQSGKKCETWSRPTWVCWHEVSKGSRWILQREKKINEVWMLG